MASARSSFPQLVFALAGLGLLAAVPGCARAESFSSTNAQLLHGAGFHDPFTGKDTLDGSMTTLTLEHFGVWAYGDNFLFLDVDHGEFVAPDGSAAAGSVRLYTEWTPRLAVGKLAGLPEGFFGPVKELYLAGQVGRGGDGYFENLIGLGVNVALPGRLVLGLNGFLRNDRFNRPTYQLTPFWSLPVPVGPTELVFAGFLDVAGTDDLGVDLHTQPQLLVDAGSFLGAPGAVHAGLEWFLHHNDAVTASAPQALVKWTF